MMIYKEDKNYIQVAPNIIRDSLMHSNDPDKIIEKINYAHAPLQKNEISMRGGETYSGLEP